MRLKPILVVGILVTAGLIAWFASRPPPAYKLLQARIAEKFSVQVLSAQYDDTPRGDDQIILSIRVPFKYDAAKDRDLANAIDQWVETTSDQDKKDMDIEGTDQVFIDLDGRTGDQAKSYVFNWKK